MRYRRRLTTPGALDDVREGVRAFYTGAGYELAGEDERAMVFARRVSALRTAFATKVEHLPATVEVMVGPGQEDASGAPRTIIVLAYDVSSRLRLVTRIDYLYLDLEVDALLAYLDTGVRADPARRLAAVRSPVAAAVAVNLLISTLLVASVGAVAGFGLPVIVAAAVAVALINLVSILGFADVLIEGMEQIRG